MSKNQDINKTIKRRNKLEHLMLLKDGSENIETSGCIIRRAIRSKSVKRMMI